MSVALVEDASPVLGAVFAPVTDEFFFAARGQGATRNAQPISVTGGTALDFARVAGPKPLVERLNPTSQEIVLHPRIALAGAAAVPGRARQSRCRLCRRTEQGLGSCRGEFDRAGSEW